MNLFTSLIPAPYQLLARILLYAALVASLVGWGFVKGVSHADAKASVQIAAMKKQWDAERLKISSVGAVAAQHTASVVIAQQGINQESDNGAQKSSSSLDARIARGGLRIPTINCSAGGGGGGGNVPAVSDATSPLADASAQSEPIATGRSAAEVQSIIDNAARDAQRLAELIDYILNQAEANPSH